jgi:hypothetical protein
MPRRFDQVHYAILRNTRTGNAQPARFPNNVSRNWTRQRRLAARQRLGIVQALTGFMSGWRCEG